jgi:hypothetical protein
MPYRWAVLLCRPFKHNRRVSQGLLCINMLQPALSSESMYNYATACIIVGINTVFVLPHVSSQQHQQQRYNTTRITVILRVKLKTYILQQLLTTTILLNFFEDSQIFVLELACVNRTPSLDIGKSALFVPRYICNVTRTVINTLF